MDKRVVDFIRALRASGVRISLAESQEALHALEQVGVQDREVFRDALKATLIKTANAQPSFEYFFPLFFTANRSPLENIPDQLSEEEQDNLQNALQSLMGNEGALQQLLRQLLNGQPFDNDQLGELAQRAGMDAQHNMSDRRRMERRLRQEAGLSQIQQLIEQLLQELQEMGMDANTLQQLRQKLLANAHGLSEQLSNFAGLTLAENMAQDNPPPEPDMMDMPFEVMGSEDADAIRAEVRKLAAKLRSRAALRQKRAKSGQIDLRRTLRSSLKYGGVPLELKQKTHHRKPSLVLICDVSTSVRYCAEFLLTMIYELQDQVAKTESFTFNADLANISMIFREHDTAYAVQKALNDNPPGYYATDLGNSLATYTQHHLNGLSNRTTVIILGDGRNNYRNPRLDLADELHRRARRLIWFVPEHPSQWGSGDSDMWEYAKRSDGCYHVYNLRSLAQAVDAVLTD